MPFKIEKRFRPHRSVIVWMAVFWALVLLPIWAFAGERKANPVRPIGHVLFCHYQPRECAASKPATIELDAKTLATLDRINRKMNARPYRSESGDKWGKGSDCEDYAIRKRQALIAAGMPAGALRYAKGTVRGEFHTVLIVRTSGGDLILDNMTTKMLKRGQSAVRLESMATANPTVWTKI